MVVFIVESMHHMFTPFININMYKSDLDGTSLHPKKQNLSESLKSMVKLRFIMLVIIYLTLSMFI